jgi:quinol monooxygenase YgiN
VSRDRSTSGGLRTRGPALTRPYEDLAILRAPGSEGDHAVRMTTIAKDAKLVTFINVFTVEPANQQRLVDLLARVTETSVRHARGFVSAALHRSLDGTKVTMYAQWRTIEDYEAMRKDPAPLPYLQEALTIARFEPGMYAVVETFAPAALAT